ncbi:MAG: energy transducer TonB [Gemmatimonadota bacterium]|nr:energy transducer TonB [Gemmatimonadota bacterium]
MPRYPEALRLARAQGSVRARFVIDANGKVRLRSVAVLSATHPLFEDAVRDVLPRLRFLPAEAGDRAVAVLVEQTFNFIISP